MDKDYSPFDHGTQTKQVGDKFYPNGATVLSGDSKEDFAMKNDEMEMDARKDEDNIPW